MATASAAAFAFVDVDVGEARERHGRAAAFVHACSLKYGLGAADLRRLGGSELARVEDFYKGDHEWGAKGPVLLRRGQARLVLRLFAESAPLACENFVRLCRGAEKDPKMTFRGCKFHRVVPGFVAQTGDFIFGNGTGGESVFSARKFKDERKGLEMKHDRRGVLSMGNSGKNSNTSQWFLTFAPAPALNGKHVVFGELVSGFECLDAIEAVASAEGGEPTVPVTITECGEWALGAMPGAGYWYDVPDPEAFAGSTPVFMAWLRVAIVAPSEAVEQRFAESLAGCTLCPVANDLALALSKLNARAVDVILVAPARAAELQDLGAPANVLVAKPAAAQAQLAAWALATGWECCWDDLGR